MKCISFVFAILMMLCATQAFAQSFKTGTIEVDQPWVRATPKGADSTAGYFRIVNSGTAADRLTGGSSSLASSVQFHEMTMTNGVMKMRPLPNGLEIKPGETIELKPNSFHAMFVGLKQPVKQGDHIKGTLTFEKAGDLEVEFAVESIGARQPASTGTGHTQMSPGMKMH
ncbi:MAG TPA: copper chaperone PCu(A)C [Xanthobacteraceae bacterium]